MLDKIDFQKKYDITLRQLHEEVFLDTVSEEDREIFTDTEILTGRNSNNRINKFNNYGKKNKGKKYDTVRGRAISAFKKFIDNKITENELDDIFDKIWSSAKAGDIHFVKELLKRMLGEEEEKVKLTIEDINFQLDLDKNAEERKKENLKDK